MRFEELEARQNDQDMSETNEVVYIGANEPSLGMYRVRST